MLVAVEFLDRREHSRKNLPHETHRSEKMGEPGLVIGLYVFTDEVMTIIKSWIIQPKSDHDFFIIIYLVRMERTVFIFDETSFPRVEWVRRR